MPRKKITKTIRHDVFWKFNGRCAYCGRYLAYDDFQVDHLVPHKGKAGEDSMENYMPACPECNAFKRNDSLEDFRSHIEASADLKKVLPEYKYEVAKIYGVKAGEENHVVFFFEKEGNAHEAKTM